MSRKIMEQTAFFYILKLEPINRAVSRFYEKAVGKLKSLKFEFFFFL